MRLSALFCVVCFTLVTMACNGSGPYAPADPSTSRLSTFETGMISVYVHWGEEGLAGKQVEVLELDRLEITNDDGIANFRVRAGAYTVRVYEINRGGPPLRYVDTKVTVTAHERTTVDVVDCLPCV
jgi:hypothetical protein